MHVLGPAAERREGDGGGHQPHARDHLGRELAVLPRRVGERPGDAQVPVGRERERGQTRREWVLRPLGMSGSVISE